MVPARLNGAETRFRLVSGGGGSVSAFEPFGLGALRWFRAGCRPAYPVVTAVFIRAWITVALAVMSRFAEAIATWRWWRFLARPR